MQVGTSFPGTQAFGNRMRELARQRGGPIYAIVDGGYNWRVDNVADANRIVQRIGLTRSETGCGTLRCAITHLRLHASVVSSAVGDKKCELGLRADDVLDTVAESHADLEVAMPMFESNGFTLDPSTCVPYHAGIGKGVLVYQLVQGVASRRTLIAGGLARCRRGGDASGNASVWVRVAAGTMSRRDADPADLWPVAKAS